MSLTMASMIKVVLNTDMSALWQGLSNQAYKNVTEAICELIDNAISAMGARLSAGDGRIDVNLTKSTLIVEDNGTWTSVDPGVLSKLLSLGGSTANKQNLNEHNYGLKQALAYMDPSNAKWKITIHHGGFEYELNAPWTNELSILNKGVSTKTGTRIELPMTDTLLRTLYRREQRSSDVNLDRCIINLHEVLRVTWMFNDPIKKRLVKIYLNSKLVEPFDIFDPSEQMAPTSKVQNNMISLVPGAPPIRLNIVECRIERNTKRHHFTRGPNKQGVYLSRGGRLIAGPLMDEVYGITPDNHYNHHIVFVDVSATTPSAYGGLPSTSTVKNEFNKRDPKYESLLHMVSDNTPPVQDKSRKNTDISEREMNKRLKHAREIALAEVNGVILADDETMALKLDGEEFECADRYDIVERVHNEIRIYEGKLDVIKPEDIWQAFRYYVRIRHAYSSAADTIKVIMVSNKSKDTSALVRDEVRLIQKQCPEFDPQFKLYSDYM